LNFERRTVRISTTANDTLSKLKRIQEQTLAFFESAAHFKAARNHGFSLLSRGSVPCPTIPGLSHAVAEAGFFKTFGTRVPGLS
jgi:hypothetical protein